MDKEDENNQKRLRDLENGQYLVSDLYGRVDVIQFHPIFEELLHAGNYKSYSCSREFHCGLCIYAYWHYDFFAGDFYNLCNVFYQ